MSTLSVHRIENVDDFDFANTHFVTAFNAANGSYAVSNAALATANASYAATNTAYNFANTVNTFAYGVAVNSAAAFAAANNVGPQIAPTYNTANAAFRHANASYTTANNALANTQDVNIQRYLQVGDFAYNGTGSRLGGNSLLFGYFGGSTIDTGGDLTFRDSSYNTLMSLKWYGQTTCNVGIGVTNPGYKLDVAGTINAANILINGASIAANLAPAFNQANAAYAAANTKFSSSGGTISGAVEITADLTVHGNTRFIDQQTLQVGDPLIYLAANNYTSDVVDIGFVANYVNATSSNVHTGLFRSSGTKEYYLFQGYDKEPYNNYIDPTGNNITMAVLNSTVRTSNLILGGANALGTIGASFNTANAAYGAANNVGPQIAPAFNTANAAYNAANNVNLSAPFNVANAAFGKANSALQNTNVTLAGNLTSTGVVTLNKFPFYESTANINFDYTINTGMNAFTPGPVAIANGVYVTIPSGSYWSVT